MGNTFVKDIMQHNVISIDSAMNVKDAAIMMADANVGCIIVTKGNAPVGILTERDFVSRIVSKYLPLTTPVTDVMSSPLIKISPEETVWELALLMKTKGIHKVAVQKDNKMVWMITTTDIANICSLGSDSEMRRICDQILSRLKDDSQK